jgi:threonine synthase
MSREGERTTAFDQAPHDFHVLRHGCSVSRLGPAFVEQSASAGRAMRSPRVEREAWALWRVAGAKAPATQVAWRALLRVSRRLAARSTPGARRATAAAIRSLRRIVSRGLGVSILVIVTSGLS